jgi:GTPase Era involved in 16S rRNA processing
MTESLDLFDTYINGSHFKDKPVILILNKFDLFKKKIQFVKLSETFEEYTGNSEQEALEFIKTQFLERNAYAENRIHIFVAEATNIQNVEKILNDILDLCESGKLIAE